VQGPLVLGKKPLQPLAHKMMTYHYSRGRG
jgi:hypothetical protein